MSAFKFPWVTPNQRIIPKDFRRAMKAVEDVVAHVAKNLIFDTAQSTASRGIVLWGLDSEDVSIPGSPRLRVNPGVALLPAGAGDQEARLCILLASTTFNLTAAVAGTRIDALMIDLVGTAESPDASQLVDEEARDFRVVVAGAETIESQNTETYREPLGVPEIVADVDSTFSPTTPADKVLLATFEVDTSGDVVSHNDLRSMAFNGPSGAAGITTDGPSNARNYFKGLTNAWSWARLLLEDLEARVSPHINVSSELTQTHTVHDGGADITLAEREDGSSGVNFNVLDLVTRRITGTLPALVRGYRPVHYLNEKNAGVVPTSAEFENDTDGLKLNGATLIRASAMVRIFDNAGAYKHHEWIGQNVSAVQRVGTRSYRVTLTNTFVETYGAWLTSGRWHVWAVMAPVNPLSAGTFLEMNQGRWVEYQCHLEATFTVLVNGIDVADGGNETLMDRSFQLFMMGPIGAGQYSGAAPDPGVQGASWNVGT